MPKEINVDLKENPKLFIQIDDKEIFVNLTASGEIRISVDNADMVILPRGANCFNLELRK